MNNNGIVRYDLQQAQQSVVQAHPEEPKEPGIGSRLFSAFVQEAPKLMETGIKAYETYDKNQKEQQKATNQAEFYNMVADFKSETEANNLKDSQIRIGTDKLYSAGLGLGLSYADINNAFEATGLNIDQKRIKDMLQSESDVKRDEQKAFADAAAAIFSDEKDPVIQQDLLSRALITEENIKTLKSAVKEIDPNSQLDFTKANFNVAMTSYVNSAYANAYSQLQNRFNTNNVIQVSQVVRQQLAEQGFSPAAIEYYVRNREKVWKRIAKTNEADTEAAQKAVKNDTQLFLDTSLQSLLQQEITVGKDTYQIGTAVAAAQVFPELGKFIFENNQLRDPFFKSFLSGSKIELPKTLDASAIKLTLGVNSMITQNIQETGSEPLKDLSEEALKTFLKGQSGEGSSKSAAGLSMVAYRNATGNLQKKDFAGREDTEADTFSHASKAISSDIEAINPGKDYVMLFDDDGTPRLYQTHLEKQLEISENMAYALEPGLAVPQYTGGKRGYAFEDVSNESFFTREYAGSAVQFLQDAATRTGKSKKELIQEFNSSMMKNSKAAKDLYKYLTDKDTAPTDDWATAKIAEARKGENKNLSQIISKENAERASEENPFTFKGLIKNLEDIPEDKRGFLDVLMKVGKDAYDKYFGETSEKTEESSDTNDESKQKKAESSTEDDEVVTTDTADFVTNTEATDTENQDEGWEQVKKDETAGSEKNLFVNGKDASEGVYLYMDSTGNVTGGVGYNYDAHPEAQKNLEKEFGISYAEIKKDLKQKWESVNKNKAVKQAVFSKDYVVKSLTDNMQKEEYNKRLNKAYASNKTFEAFCNNDNIPANIRALLKSATYNTKLTDSKTITKGMEEIQKGNVQEGAEKLVKGFVFSTSQKNKNKKGNYTRSRTGRGTKMLNAVNDFLLSKGLNPIKDSDANSLLSL